MIEVASSEFAKNFGRYKEMAQREPVAITSHGRKSGYFLSEHEYAEYQRLKALSRRSYTINTLPEEIYQEIINAKVDPKYEYLNSLLDDEESPDSMT